MIVYGGNLFRASNYALREDPTSTLETTQQRIQQSEQPPASGESHLGVAPEQRQELKQQRALQELTA